MSASPFLTVDQLFQFPPMVFGTIRWKKPLGKPSGDPCLAFDILVEAHEVTEWRISQSGKPEAVPDTGQWKTISDSVSCQPLVDQGDDYVLRFQVTDLDYNTLLDDFYRITPQLTRNWNSSPFLSFFGYRAIKDISFSCKLTKDRPVQFCDFEVVRRSWLSGRQI